jgi:hypothetical protein
MAKPKRKRKRRKYQRQPKYNHAAIIKVVHDYLDKHDGKLPPTKPGRRPSIDGLIAKIEGRCGQMPGETVMKEICGRAVKMWRAGR